jgi:hypothetical protein
VAATVASDSFFQESAAVREARSAALLNAKGLAKNHHGHFIHEMAISTAGIPSSIPFTRHSQPVSQPGVHPE